MTEYDYLHPLRTGELLDRAIRLYRNNFLTATWITAAFSLPALVLELLIPGDLSSLTSLIAAPLGIIMTGALVYLFGQTYLSKEAAFKDSVRIGWARFWTIFGANFLQGLAIGLSAGIPYAIIALALKNPILGFIIIMPIAVFLGARWSVTDCAIILEGSGASDSLTRSWNLTKLSMWRVIAISLTLSALGLLLSGLPIIFFTYFSQFVENDLPPNLLSGIGSAIGTFGALITTPVSMATYVVMFYDLRIRHEGFDLLMRAQTEIPDELPTSE